MSLPQVFITYTNKDGSGKRFAIELQRILSRNGYDTCIFDHLKQEHLGAELWYLLTAEIMKRQVLVVLCTRDIKRSRGARFEINHALEGDKLIVPLRFGDAPVPDPIVIYLRDHFNEANYESVFTSVAKRLAKSYEEHSQQSEIFREKPSPEPKIVTTPDGGDQHLDSIIKRYHRDSVVEHVSVVENYNASLHSGLTFGSIGVRLATPRDVFGDPSHYLIVDRLGTYVAWGERNYLMDLWRRHVQTQSFPLTRFTFQGFREILNELSSGMNPKVLFAPIDMFPGFMSMLINAPLGTRPVKWGDGESLFVWEDGKELRIRWSNKYAPLDCFVLIDPLATRWYVKPDAKTGDRLTAIFVEDEKDPKTKVDFLATTVVSARLVNPDRLKLFKFE